MKTLKALVAAAVAFLGTVTTALGDDAVTNEEWGLILASALAAYGLVYKARNAPA